MTPRRGARARPRAVAYARERLRRRRVLAPRTPGAASPSSSPRWSSAAIEAGRDDAQHPRHRRLHDARRVRRAHRRHPRANVPRHRRGDHLACTATTTSGLATANTLAGVCAPARARPRCTINGIGERAGNCVARGGRDGAPHARAAARPAHRHRHARSSRAQPRWSRAHRLRGAREQGDRRRQRVRARVGHPPGRHAQARRDLRDHAARDVGVEQHQPGARQALAAATRSPTRLQRARLPARRRGSSTRVVRALQGAAPTRRRTSPTPTSRRWCADPERRRRPLATGRSRSQVAAAPARLPTATVRLRGRDGDARVARRPSAPARSTPRSRRSTRIVGVDRASCVEYQVRAVTEGIDALGEVVVRGRESRAAAPYPRRAAPTPTSRRQRQGVPRALNRMLAAPRLRALERPPRAEVHRGDAVDEPRTLFEKIWDAHVVAAGDRRDARGALRRPAPRARGHLAAGVRRLRERGLRVRRPERTVATMDHSTPTTPRPAGASCRPTRRRAAQLRQLDAELRGASASRCYGLGTRAAGHRARDRARARAHAAGHDHRLRRQPHRHARRVRRARVRHRHERGRARARDAVPAAAAAEDAGGARRRQAARAASPPRT